MGFSDPVGYALLLLRRKGYSIEFMDSRYVELGVVCWHTWGKVRTWLDCLSDEELEALIEKLKEKS